jgi:hypothetical protein
MDWTPTPADLIVEDPLVTGVIEEWTASDELLRGTPWELSGCGEAGGPGRTPGHALFGAARTT